jgi:hypothetical protein
MTKYKYNSFDEAMDAIEDDASNFQYVRPDLITPQMAIIAIKYLSCNLKHVPSHLTSEETALAIIREWEMEDEALRK